MSRHILGNAQATIAHLENNLLPFVWGTDLVWQATVRSRDLGGEHAAGAVTATFGGTPTDGDYVSRFYDRYGALIATVTTTRDTGDPPDNGALASQHATDIEDSTDLTEYVASVQATGVDVDVEYSGQMLRMVTEAPGAAVVDNVHSAQIRLNELHPKAPFPFEAIRSSCSIRVVRPFAAESVASLDNYQEANSDVLLAVPIDERGWSFDTDTSLGDDDKLEIAWDPVLDLEVGADPFGVDGLIRVQVVFSPIPVGNDDTVEIARGSATPSGVTSTIPMAAAAAFDNEDYWAMRSGRTYSSYLGAYLLVGANDYVWWTHDGQGSNPGGWVAALAGRTGHVVDLPAGNRTQAQVAAETAPVIDALGEDWSATPAGGSLEIVGPEAVAVGPGWDAAVQGGVIGSRSSRVGGPAYAAGPIDDDCIAQHLPNPGLDLPIVALDILIDDVPANNDRWRVALWTAAGGTALPAPAGESLIYDLGQLTVQALTTDGYARIPIPPDVTILANQAMWVSIKGNTNSTRVGGRLTGDTNTAELGDWTIQNLRRSNQANPGNIDPNPAVGYPATWTGDVQNQNPFVCDIRLVVATGSHDASYGSAANPIIWGTHTEDVNDLQSSTNIDSHVFMVSRSPDYPDMRVTALAAAVGDVRGTQMRLGLFTGGDDALPSEPLLDGATLLVDAGQSSEAGTRVWDVLPVTETPWPANVVSSWVIKCDDDVGGTDIAFAQNPSWDQADAVDSPVDWPESTAASGPEYELFPDSSPGYALTDPTVGFQTPVANTNATVVRPGNIPGAQVHYRIPGMGDDS